MEMLWLPEGAFLHVWVTQETCLRGYETYLFSCPVQDQLIQSPWVAGFDLLNAENKMEHPFFVFSFNCFCL